MDHHSSNPVSRTLKKNPNTPTENLSYYQRAENFSSCHLRPQSLNNIFKILTAVAYYRLQQFTCSNLTCSLNRLKSQFKLFPANLLRLHSLQSICSLSYQHSFSTKTVILHQNKIDMNWDQEASGRIYSSTAHSTYLNISKLHSYLALHLQKLILQPIFICLKKTENNYFTQLYRGKKKKHKQNPLRLYDKRHLPSWQNVLFLTGSKGCETRNHA